ncbi:MAG: hypothetical protein AAGB48_12680 [Planctomycetota bacterium]
MSASNTNGSSLRAAFIMFVYAGVLFGLALLAYVSAPVGAKAATALVVGGGSAAIMTVMGIMSMMLRRNRKLGMIGIHVGMVLPLVFAAAFWVRIGASYKSAGVHDYFYGAYARAVESGDVADTGDARSAFLRGGREAVGGDEIPEHSKAYLGRIFTLLFGASVITFGLLLASRPSVPKAEDNDEKDTIDLASDSGSKDPFA